MRRTDGILKLLGLCLLAGVLLAGVMFPAIGGIGVLSNQASATVENTSSELASEPPPLVTRITDSKGKTIATWYQQYRIPTSGKQISDAMKWALISIEDKRFYEHNGVDWKGTIRAAISNTSGGDTQGASTLTQQYVKNYLINVVYWNDKDPAHKIGRQKAQEQSIARKLKEARIAINLESKMDKEEILTGYLNVVEFSRRIFGVGAAAKAYFGTSAKNLDPAQAALLAGMVNNPATNDPWNHPNAAKKRRNLVLDKMVENRKLSAADAERYKRKPLGVVSGGPKKPAANCVGAGKEHGFFCQFVQDYLVERGMDLDELYTGGYTIKTTLDRKANLAAAKSTEKQVPKENRDVALTLSLVKPGKKRHEVIGLATNRDYGPDEGQNQTELPLPSGVRNPQGAGSSYKIFTAGAALEEGVMGLNDRIAAPGHYTSKVFTGGADRCGGVPGKRPYCVQNYAGSKGGNPTLQMALANSPNTAFVILEEKTGMRPVVEMASKLGMRKTMAANTAGYAPDKTSDRAELNESQLKHFGPTKTSKGKASFTLGPVALSGLELANVGATIMSDGVWCPPTPIKSITDRNGNLVTFPKKDQPCEQAVSKGVANALADGLSKDHTNGTARGAASKFGWNRPMIGKTGTAQEHTASTFMGATPQLAGASMIFQPDGHAEPLCVGGPMGARTCGDGNMFGGVIPAQTWFGAMVPIHKNLPKKQVPKSPKKFLRQG